MFSNRTTTRSTQEIASDFSQLVAEGRALLGELMEKPQEGASNLRTVLDDVSEKLAGFQSSAAKAAQQGAKQGAKYARQADRYLHENPWPTVAAGIILGVLATLWWSERR
jgi:ElaB/YqjD/DUF883 family membrane-anchored ribosome-binding protein